MEADKIIRFKDMALLELKRAERYRNFLSLLVLNLSEFLHSAGRRKIDSPKDADEFLKNVLKRIKLDARETDIISDIGTAKLVMLLPETDKKGAEITGKRMEYLLSDLMGEFLESNYQFEVPIEINSFPEVDSEEESFKSRLNSLLGKN